MTQKMLKSPHNNTESWRMLKNDTKMTFYCVSNYVKSQTDKSKQQQNIHGSFNTNQWQRKSHVRFYKQPQKNPLSTLLRWLIRCKAIKIQQVLFVDKYSLILLKSEGGERRDLQITSLWSVWSKWDLWASEGRCLSTPELTARVRI